MSAKLRVSALLASVCLFGVVAGGAVFAQEAVVAPAVDQAPANALGFATEQAAAASLPLVTMAVPGPDEPTGFEIYDDGELQYGLEARRTDLAEIDTHIEDLEQTCEGDCEADLERLTAYRDNLQNDIDHLNEEIRRRIVVVEPEPEPTPAAAPAVRREVTADATPPSDFCAALTAKGDYSDCGWSFRQTQ